MNISIAFTRLIFVFLSYLFSYAFTHRYFSNEWSLMNGAIILVGGTAIAALLISLDFIFRRFNLKLFNSATIGLFAGYLMASSILFIIEGITGPVTDSLMPLRYFVYLVMAYLGIIMTLRSSEELHLSIPFIQFKQTSHKKKDILMDVSILSDPRIIDLAALGLLDHHLIIPKFALKELYHQLENGDETQRAKARRSIDVLKKLEALPTLDLRYVDTDFPEIKDPMNKLVRLARFLDTNIITSDINRVQQSSIEEVRIINIHMLSKALKPITQNGEFLTIKIQRYGKEARQGVGYLEDGTMVVINGGAEYIGETIRAQVLSVKHTSSGRMIFCNTCENEDMLHETDYDDNDSHEVHSEDSYEEEESEPVINNGHAFNSNIRQKINKNPYTI